MGHEDVEVAKCSSSAMDSPYDYSRHLQRIEDCKKIGDAQSLRSAREAMLAVFPLSEDLWVEWTHDELADVTSSARKKYICQLLKRAVGDYLSIPLWSQYVAYVSADFLDSANAIMDLESVRSVCSQAIQATGWHLAESHLVWNLVCSFEQAVIDRSPLPENIARLRSLFRERLKTPHATIDETASAYSRFETQYDNQNYEAQLSSISKHISQASSMFSSLEIHETRLSSLESYRAYISANTQSHFLTRTLYERALKLYCTEKDLWSEYLEFLFSKLRVEVVLATVLERAIRNVPWSGEIWAHLLRSKELYSPLDLKASVERAVAHPLLSPNVDELVAVLVTFNECQRRVDKSKLLDELTWSRKNLFKLIPTGDPQHRIDLLRIKLVVPEEAEKIFATLTKKDPSNAAVWSEFASYAESRGDVTKAQSIYKHALGRALTDPTLISDKYLEFERLHGDLDSVYDALGRIRGAKKAWEKTWKEYQNAMDYQLQLQEPVKPTTEATKGHKLAEKAAVIVEDQGIRGTKRSAENDVEPPAKKFRSEDDEKHILDCAFADQCVFIQSVPEGTTTNDILSAFKYAGDVEDVTLFKNHDTANLSAIVEFALRSSVEKSLRSVISVRGRTLSMQACQHKRIKWHFREDEDPSTIYVNHIPHALKKYDLRDFFKAVGEIKDIRLIRKKENVCFAYIQFEDSKSAHAACRFDGKEIRPGKKVSVAISDPRRRKINQLNIKELHITNLPFSLTKEGLYDLFKEYGKLKDIRLLFDMQGRSRGVAFIEYEDEASARSALQKNGCTISGRVISVNIADPNIKKSKRINEPVEKSSTSSQDNLAARTALILGYPENTSKNELENLFSPFGLSDILELDPSAATIQFDSVDDAVRAVQSLNGSMFKDSPLIVEIVEPPHSETEPRILYSKPVTMFAPRKQKLKMGTKPRPVNSLAPHPPSNLAALNSMDEVSNSNDDFRTLFLRK